ncbi:hypothetical protein SMA60_28345, partial [Escherichia coli]|uniref:hypothetical protein n=1 Tax=Escherichia coli TaxID=562 RepID=UPI00307AA8B7
ERFWADPLLLFYTIFVTTFQLSRVVGAMLYSRTLRNNILVDSNNPLDLEYEPTVSFVIPCKNEEASIAETIQKCFEADYPKDKIEV